MKCQLCGQRQALYRCTDPCMGVVHTCGSCRFPRMKEFRSVQPSENLVPAVRLGQVVGDHTGTGQGSQVLVCVCPPDSNDLATAQWELREADQGNQRVR